MSLYGATRTFRKVRYPGRYGMVSGFSRRDRSFKGVMSAVNAT
jgi:hypothetical protein